MGIVIFTLPVKLVSILKGVVIICEPATKGINIFKKEFKFFELLFKTARINKCKYKNYMSN